MAVVEPHGRGRGWRSADPSSATLRRRRVHRRIDRRRTMAMELHGAGVARRRRLRHPQPVDARSRGAPAASHRVARSPGSPSGAVGRRAATRRSTHGRCACRADCRSTPSSGRSSPIRRCRRRLRGAPLPSSATGWRRAIGTHCTSIAAICGPRSPTRTSDQRLRSSNGVVRPSRTTMYRSFSRRLRLET